MTIGLAVSRIAFETKAFVLRFAGSLGWYAGSSTAYMGRRNRAALYVGDGSGNSIVVAAVGWIQRNFPEAPPRVREYDSDGELEKTLDVGALAAQRLLRRPNPKYGRRLMEMALIADFTIDGNAYELKVRDTREDTGTAGRVVSRWWAPSWSIEPKRREGSTEFVDYYRYRPDSTHEYELEPSEVIHHRYGFDPENPMKGRSPLKSVLREIYTDEEASAYTATILKNLGVPGIIISPGDETVDIEEEDADGIKAQFAGEFGGEGRGRPMVLGANAKVDRVSFSPNELTLADLRAIPEERVTGAIGVPAIIAGQGAGLRRSTFANYAEAREAGYEENIIPTQGLWGDDYDIQLMPDFVDDPEQFHVDYDLSEVRVLQEDENKMWERAVNAFSKGAMTLRALNQMTGQPVDEEERDAYFLRDMRLISVEEFSPEATGTVPPPEPNPEQPPTGAGVPPGTVPIPPPAPGSSNGNGNGRARGPVPAQT